MRESTVRDAFMQGAEEIRNLRAEVERLKGSLEGEHASLVKRERDLIRLRAERGEARGAWGKIQNEWVGHMGELNDDVTKYRALTREAAGLLKELAPEEEPWDVDQDCRYCGGHFGKHGGACRWALARAFLAKLKKDHPEALK